LCARFLFHQCRGFWDDLVDWFSKSALLVGPNEGGVRGGKSSGLIGELELDMPAGRVCGLRRFTRSTPCKPGEEVIGSEATLVTPPSGCIRGWIV